MDVVTPRDGERILYEGFAKGSAFRWSDLFFYLQWLFVCGVATWLWQANMPSLLPGGPTWLGFSPLALLPFCAALALYQRAAWNARRYVVTDERVIIITGVFRREERSLERNGQEAIRRRLDQQIILTGLTPGPLELPGLDQADLDDLQDVLKPQAPE